MLRNKDKKLKER